MWFIHEHVERPLDPRKTPSEKVVAAIGISLAAAVVGTLAIASLPLVGAVYAFDGACAAASRIRRRCKEHKERKEHKEPHLRFALAVPRIDALKLWQARILELDQHERACLQLHEAGDVPYEQWHALRTECTDEGVAAFFVDMAGKAGTPAYDKDRARAVQLATEFHVARYAAAKGLTREEAAEHMRRVCWGGAPAPA